MAKKYIPDPLYWTKEEKDNFLDVYGKILKRFFNFPDVQINVARDNWNYVFDIWEDQVDHNPMNHGLVADVLAFFLYKYAKIDFMKNLDYEKYSIRSCNLADEEDL